LDSHQYAVQKLAEKVNTKAITLQHLAGDIARRSTAVQEKCNAFINFDRQMLEKGVDNLQQKIDQNKSLPLAGVPFTLSDAICAAGTVTTCASRIMGSYKPPLEATVAQRLKECGAILVGKTNMDEFNLGTAGKNSLFGEIKNPWDKQYTAGSGAAAAVSGQAASVALAADGCGELRQAASYCGLTSLKPTYGRVSRKGLVDSAPSLEQIGLIAPTVTDLAAVLEHISGYDAGDPTSFRHEVPVYISLLDGEEDQALKVAVPENWAETPYLEQGIKEAFISAQENLKVKGFQVETVAMPNFFHSLVTTTIIRAVETFSSLSNYDGVRFGLRAEGGSNLQEMYRKSRTEGFGSRVKQFITFGSLISAGKYYDQVFQKAQKMRTLIIKELEKCLEAYDLLFIPTVPFAAPLHVNDNEGGFLPDPAGYYTAAANLAGLPAVSFPMPAETAPSGSAGMQFIGKAWDEVKLLQASMLLKSENPPRFPSV
jgi:aspartyl-tRNA(Asn)/glutamyl-tRNA(Gln) amidotransferase subunit A